PKRIVEHEHPNAGPGPLDEQVAQHVRHATGLAVVGLHEDESLRRAEILPQAGKGAVPIDRQLDLVARRKERSGEEGNSERRVRVGRGKRLTGGFHSAYTTYRRPTRRVEKADEGGEQENRECQHPKDQADVIHDGQRSAGTEELVRAANGTRRREHPCTYGCGTAQRCGWWGAGAPFANSGGRVVR